MLAAGRRQVQFIGGCRSSVHVVDGLEGIIGVSDSHDDRLLPTKEVVGGSKPVGLMSSLGFCGGSASAAHLRRLM